MADEEVAMNTLSTMILVLALISVWVSYSSATALPRAQVALSVISKNQVNLRLKIRSPQGQARFRIARTC